MVTLEHLADFLEAELELRNAREEIKKSNLFKKLESAKRKADKARKAAKSILVAHKDKISPAVRPIADVTFEEKEVTGYTYTDVKVTMKSDTIRASAEAQDKRLARLVKAYRKTA